MAEFKAAVKPVAVIAMDCRFPGAENVEAFWRNLRNGKESVSFLPDDELFAAGNAPELLNHAGYVKAGAIVQDIGFSSRTAGRVKSNQSFGVRQQPYNCPQD